MGYALYQTPVPPWAAPDQHVLQIDHNRLPSFLLPENDSKKLGNLARDRLVFLKQSGRWNSLMNHEVDVEAQNVRSTKEGAIDEAMLDQYDLNTEWENRMDDTERVQGGLAEFDRFRISFINNLAGNPFFPIVLRGSASTFAIVTLGLACAVFVQTKKVAPSLHGTGLIAHSPSSSTIFSIVISTIGIVYLLFSTWDETFGQPLGLRPSRSKIKFVAIDLTLICLTAANLAVSFDAMISRPYICPAIQNPYVCRLHKAVVSFIFATLAMWFLTILVSTFRMIDRATH